ncbi:hypothetical protein U8607_24110 [Methylobacterium durans]|uniref:hypothetical protein n=1 Tax=Methylobacterium durans TaxID=2202825 RepID=UPI002AFF3D3F|nr:hypothetical protein [Methylobacterium durans]MEA1835175.1 hypothetical protein [Methylobacterium durans]
MILFAGPAAQAIHDPQSDIRRAATRDLADARNLAIVACRSPDSVAPFLRWARSEARALVRVEWHCVEALASALQLKDTLSGEKAVSIMEAADLDHRARLLAAQAAASAFRVDALLGQLQPLGSSLLTNLPANCALG